MESLTLLLDSLPTHEEIVSWLIRFSRDNDYGFHDFFRKGSVVMIVKVSNQSPRYVVEEKWIHEDIPDEVSYFESDEEL